MNMLCSQLTNNYEIKCIIMILDKAKFIHPLCIFLPLPQHTSIKTNHTFRTHQSIKPKLNQFVNKHFQLI